MQVTVPLDTILLNHHINTIIGSYFCTHFKDQESKVQRETLQVIQIVSGRTNNVCDLELNAMFSIFLHGLPFGGLVNDIAYSLKFNAVSGEPISPSFFFFF